MNEDDKSIINDILAPLRGNIDETNKALSKIQMLFEEKFLQQQRQIDNQQTQVQGLNARLLFQESLTNLHDRKIDDQEQISRKNNLRIKGLVVEDIDTPIKLKDFVTNKIQTAKIEIPVNDVDRVHRVGKVYFTQNKRVQDALIRFRSWDSRNKVYQNRKELSFKVAADLTKRRTQLLSYIYDQINEVKVDTGDEPAENKTLSAVSKVVDFVLADKNCKIKFKSKTNWFYAVNSKYEFWAQVNRLDNELTLSKVFIADEENRSNYGKYDEEKTLDEIYY